MPRIQYCKQYYMARNKTRNVQENIKPLGKNTKSIDKKTKNPIQKIDNNGNQKKTRK